MKDEASYTSDSCGEEIVVPIDLTAGTSQEYVEDCVLPVHDREGIETGKQMVRYTIVLTLAGMLPCAAGVGGWFSGIGGLALSLVFLYNTLRFLKTRTTSDARRVFRFSLLYLPAFFVLLALDRASPNLMGH